MKKLKSETKLIIAAVLIPAIVTLLALAPFPQGIKIIGDLVFQERSAVATTPVAGTGTFYVKNTTPSTPIFVNDAGTETTLGAGGGGGGDPTYGSDGAASDNSVYVDAANEVGIGTTAPDAPMHIYSTAVAPRIISQYYSTTTGNATEYAATITGTTPGTSPTWVNPTNAGADDASDAFIGKIGSGSADGQTLKLVDMGFAIPSTATVVGVEVAITGSMYNLIAEKDIFLVRGGTPDTGTNKATGATWSNVEAVHTFGGAADDWGGFTAAEVNNAGFGVTFQPTFTGIGNMYIDFITIKVYYSVAGDYTWSTATDILDGAWTIRGNGVDLFRMAYAGGAATFTGVVDADGYKQDGVLYDLSTFGAGGGDVVGPAISVDGAIARFGDTTGKVLENTSLIIDPSGNLTLTSGDTIDGRDVSVDGAKLDGIETAATADQTNAEIETAYNAQVGIVSQAVAEAGTSTTAVRWTPERVKQAIDALATPAAGDVVGPASSVDVQVPTFNGTTGKLLRASPVYIATATGNMSGVGTINTLSFSPSSGNFVMETNSQTLANKRMTPRVDTITSAATPSVDTDGYDIYRLTAQAATITSFTTNLTGTPAVGQQIRINIKDDGTARAITTWGASFASGPATLPTTTVATKNLHTLHEWDGAIWRCMAAASDP